MGILAKMTEITTSSPLASHKDVVAGGPFDFLVIALVPKKDSPFGIRLFLTSDWRL